LFQTTAVFFIGYVQNRDTLRDLRASLYYYEHVADSKGDAARQDAITRTTQKLKDMLLMMSKKLDGWETCITIVFKFLNITLEIDHKIGTLQEELAGLFNCPEFQNYRVSHIWAPCVYYSHSVEFVSMTFVQSSCTPASLVVSRYTLMYGMNTMSGGRRLITRSQRYFT